MPQKAYYPADEVDALMGRALAGIRLTKEAALQYCNENEILRNRVAELEKAAASPAPKVTLEKVASASTDGVQRFVSRLVDMALIPEKEREKVAAACLKSPDNIIELAEEALKLSTAPVPQGSGVTTKRASRTLSTDPSGYTDDEMEIFNSMAQTPYS